MARDVIGIYRTREGAARGVDSLTAAGFAQPDISVLMSDSAQGKHFALEEHSKAAAGVAAGGVAGGVLGAVAAGLTAVASIAIPGIGILVAGPLVAALAGGGAGATAGGLIGGMIGLGVKEHEAKLYEDEVRRGGMLVGVRVENDERADLARQVFRDTGALNFA